MSTGCVEPLRLSSQDNDVVEDAFLNSPLPELGEEVRTIHTACCPTTYQWL